MNIPRSEYPRPELVRADNWLNLNGQWQFAFDFGNSGRERRLWDADDAVYTHEITVPFAPESKLSGIEYVDFIAACWYRRTVVLPAAWKRETERILLHFGAVDYRSEVYVNGKKAGYHVGGYTPFTFDVTEYVIPGENRIAVFAEDNGRDPLQPTGKQVYYSYYNSGCSYTRSTGIWQTVWMEYVPQSYVQRLKITPCIDGGEVSCGNVKLETRVIRPRSIPSRRKRRSAAERSRRRWERSAANTRRCGCTSRTRYYGTSESRICTI